MIVGHLNHGGFLTPTGAANSDSVEGHRVNREPYFPLDAMCRIRYLTDVTPETPAFAVVPDSRRFDTLAEAREALEDYHEVPLYAPAGTCILYDNATFHTRLDGTAEPSLPRRTLHQYFARGGWDRSTSAGVRAPLRPQTDWNVRIATPTSFMADGP